MLTVKRSKIGQNLKIKHQLGKIGDEGITCTCIYCLRCYFRFDTFVFVHSHKIRWRKSVRLLPLVGDCHAFLTIFHFHSWSKRDKSFQSRHQNFPKLTPSLLQSLPFVYQIMTINFMNFSLSSSHHHFSLPLVQVVIETKL